MGFFDRIVGNAINSVATSAGNQIGDAIGNATGQAISGIAKEYQESVTTDMQKVNQDKKIQMEKDAQAARHEMEDNEKAQNLPPKCPHCKAPTNKKLVCEYCGCKVIE